MKTVAKRSLLGGLGIGLVFGFGLVACSGSAGGGGAPGDLATIDKALATTMIDKGIVHIKVSTPKPSREDEIAIHMASSPGTLSTGYSLPSELGGPPVTLSCSTGTGTFTQTTSEISLSYDHCVMGTATYDGSFTMTTDGSDYEVTYDSYSMENSHTGNSFFMKGKMNAEEDVATGDTTMTVIFETYKMQTSDNTFELADSNMTATQTTSGDYTRSFSEYIKTGYTGGWLHMETTDELSGSSHDSCPSSGSITLTGASGGLTVKIKFIGSDTY
jgi:hypothetical protein